VHIDAKETTTTTEYPQHIAVFTDGSYFRN